MGRQILRGLQYLHSKDPPITHGDLRCDKIYVNGHSGEIKIGDLGLATLMPYRWEGSGPAPQQLPMDASCDIFAFGLCILELLTLKQLDPQHCDDWPHLVANVQVIACLFDPRGNCRRSGVVPCHVVDPYDLNSLTSLRHHGAYRTRRPGPSSGSASTPRGRTPRSCLRTPFWRPRRRCRGGTVRAVLEGPTI